MDTPNTNYTVFWPDGTRTNYGCDLSPDPGYLALKKVVTPHLDGADMEHVTVLHEGERRDIFVDDIGRVKGLPVNTVATAIYRNNWLTQHPDHNPASLPAIYGPAVLFYRRVWF